MVNPQQGPYNNIQSLVNRARAKANRFRIDINDWCDQSFIKLENEHVDQSLNINKTSDVWVVKYVKTKYLRKFFDNNHQLNVSLGPNYTWGDAVYVAPIYASYYGQQDYQAAYTSAMFGRAGIVGYIPLRDARGLPQLKVFDASKDNIDGIKLYREWIKQQSVLYDHLTSSMHAQQAKYYLVKIFRWTFKIDMICFNPDEYNERYVDEIHDHWFAVSAWEDINNIFNPSLPSHQIPIAIPPNITPYSDRVKNCRWVIRVEEEFERNDSNYQYNMMIGDHIKQVTSTPALNFRSNRNNIYNEIIRTYQSQSNSTSPDIDDSEQLVLKISNSDPKRL